MPGLTDGTATEIVSGDVQSGDTIVIGDGTQAASTPAPPSAMPFPLLGPAAEQKKFDLGASTIRFVLEEQRDVAQTQMDEPVACQLHEIRH